MMATHTGQLTGDPKEEEFEAVKIDDRPSHDIKAIAEEAAARDSAAEIEISEGKQDPIPKVLHFELRGDKETGWNWVLWASNHRAIATNPKPYKRRNDAERAIRRMRNEAKDARIVIATM